MRRTVVALDVAVRAALVWLLAIGIWRLTRSCSPNDFCDDPGLGTMFVVPLAVYLAWNVVAIVVELSAALSSTRPWAAGMVALAAIPRLVVLVALTSTGDAPWPVVVLFAITVVSQVLAFVHIVRRNSRGDAQSSA